MKLLKVLGGIQLNSQLSAGTSTYSSQKFQNWVDISFLKVSKVKFFNVLDKLNLYELYNGVKKTTIEMPSLGMQETLNLLDQKYEVLAGRNEQYLGLNHECVDIKNPLITENQAF